METSRVLTHPFVIGELVLGNLKNRAAIIENLKNLPHAIAAADAEVFDFIERYALFDQGIGYIDAHLLAATRLNAGARLWTRDKRLASTADRLGLRAEHMQ